MTPHLPMPQGEAPRESPKASERIFTRGRGWLRYFVLPQNFVANMPGQLGLSVGRTLAATAMLAVSFMLMKTFTTTLIAGLVIPLWSASLGTLIDGQRGAARGVLFSVVYPIYCTLIVTAAMLVFWLYALTHRLVAGQEVW